jgi:hypothetical protein
MMAKASIRARGKYKKERKKGGKERGKKRKKDNR